MRKSSTKFSLLENEALKKTGRALKQDEAFVETLLYFFTDVSNVIKFTGRFLKEFFLPPYEFKEVIKQCYEVGYRSISLVALTGFIMGLVLTLQSRPTLAEFGAASLLPRMVSISIIREIGPVITALICAGKIGSGIGAELGSMKVTEQIDSMEVSGTNPFKYLVVTRTIATTLMVPFLAILSDAISLYGSYVGVNINGKVSLTLFFSQAFHSLSYSDLLPATIKTFFFGFAIGLIGCFKGYYSSNGTEGVGQAANTSVVVASLLIFFIDMIVVQITNILGFN